MQLVELKSLFLTYLITPLKVILQLLLLYLKYD